MVYLGAQLRFLSLCLLGTKFRRFALSPVSHGEVRMPLSGERCPALGV